MINIVRDCTDLANAFWIADTFAIPLKTQEQPLGLMTVQELHLALQVLFYYVFMNFDETQKWKVKKVCEV
jgi:hypothetical protein